MKDGVKNSQNNPLYRFRAEHDLSQPELARFLGLNVHTVNQYERQARKVPKWVIDCCEDTKMSAEYLEKRLNAARLTVLEQDKGLSHEAALEALKARQKKNPFRRWRKMKGYSQAMAAEVLGIRLTIVVEMDEGNRDIPEEIKRRIEQDEGN